MRGPTSGGDGESYPGGGRRLKTELLQHTAARPGGGGQCNSCNALPHCQRAMGSGTSAMHCHTARGKWAMQLLQCTATPPGGIGQWNSRNVRAHLLRGRGVLPKRRSPPTER